MNETNKNTFSSFKQYMKMFENEPKSISAEKEIDKFLTDKQIIMVFKYPIESSKQKQKKDKIAPRLYGATEAGRLAYARMKDPQKDDMGAIDNFQAYDLEHLIQNATKPDDFQHMKIFDKDDIKNLEIIEDPKEAAKKLAHLIGNKGIETAKSKKPAMLFKDNPDE